MVVKAVDVDKIVVDEPGDVEVDDELVEVVVEDKPVLDELEDDVVKIDVDKPNDVVVDDGIVLDDEVVARLVEEELDEVEEVINPETNVTVLISEDS